MEKDLNEKLASVVAVLNAKGEPIEDENLKILLSMLFELNVTQDIEAFDRIMKKHLVNECYNLSGTYKDIAIYSFEKFDNFIKFVCQLALEGLSKRLKDGIMQEGATHIKE